jgi:hypothetical protein
VILLRDVGLIHPGWVKTDMGGPNGLIDVQTSVEGMLEQAEKNLFRSCGEVLYRFDGETITW